MSSSPPASSPILDSVSRTNLSTFTASCCMLPISTRGARAGLFVRSWPLSRTMAISPTVQSSRSVNAAVRAYMSDLSLVDVTVLALDPDSVLVGVPVHGCSRSLASHLFPLVHPHPAFWHVLVLHPSHRLHRLSPTRGGSGKGLGTLARDGGCRRLFKREKVRSRTKASLV